MVFGILFIEHAILTATRYNTFCTPMSKAQKNSIKSSIALTNLDAVAKKQMLNKSREATHNTFESVSTFKASVAELETVTELVNKHINSIANSTTEQSTASDAVNRDIDVLTDIAQNTGSLATNMHNIVSHYQHQVSEVHQQLAKFKV